MITTRFSELSLHPSMQKAIDERGFYDATAVQAQTIPLTRSGVDILAQSQTGTGKTIAFSIPALERIQPDSNDIQVLILSPTRELAQQCAEEVRKLTPYMPHVRTADIFGGSDYRTQFHALRKANIVIGTPGRIMDHMRRGTIKLHNLEMIVLDEADEMLNMGFKEDVETILTDAPENRQTVLFSATVPKSILQIAKQFQKDPVQINLTQDKIVLNEIKQLYVDAPKQYKDRALSLLLHQLQPKRSIIFTNTKSMVDDLAKNLCEEGFMAQGIHGDMKQNQRSNVMASFKAGKTQILVATDVAARGIDVQDIDYVFNYDLPKIPEYYVHRIGRTGRAGRSGTAISICCGKQQLDAIRSLAKKSQSNIVEMELPTKSSIQAQQLELNIAKVRKELERKPNKQSKAVYSRLIQEGYNPEDLACALMNLSLNSTEVNIEDIPPSKRRKSIDNNTQAVSDKKAQKTSATSILSFNIGSSCRCNAKHLVGAITECAGISSKQIGKIVIEDNLSFVSLPEELTETVIKAMRKVKICGKYVQIFDVSFDIKKEKPNRKASSEGRNYPRKHEKKSKEGRFKTPRRSSKSSSKKNLTH